MQPGFEIRPVRREERRALCGLWMALVGHHRALDPEYPAAEALRETLLAEIERGLSRPTCLLVGAEQQGRLIGFAFAERSPSSGGQGTPSGGAWVHELWVDPSARRSGVGSALLERAEAFLRETGVARVSVRVEAANTPGLEFWRRRGYLARAHVLERAPTD